MSEFCSPSNLTYIAGKFTYHVVPEAGHYVHEDAPQRTANIIAEFFKRNDQNLFTLPPKVSEMLARGEKV